MNCPRCKSAMDEIYTKKGVYLDHCKSCQGVWLDEGEIYFFAKKPKRLKKFLDQPFQQPKHTKIPCPRCQAELIEGGLISKDLRVDKCSGCEGLWFDDSELQTLNRLLKAQLAIEKEEFKAEAPVAATAPPRPSVMLPLPNLFFRSATVLGTLFGFLFIGVLVAVEFFEAPLGVMVLIAIGIIVIQFLISPFIMDFTLKWFQSLRWVEPEELPQHLKGFIAKIVSEKNIPFPKMGIIEDGTPNAFTYGHTPRNARIVVTRGLLNILTPEEAEAVVAHELGHALHWDMLVMTVAAIVPLIFYYIYRAGVRMSAGRGKNNPGPLVAIGGFILYIISQYMVLWLSRTREYYADRFAGQATSNPNALVTALVKIAYGLAKGDEKNVEGEKKRGESKLAGVSALGIFDPKGSRTLAITAAGKGGAEMNEDAMTGAMKWDLWNPWATYYEIHSTHPLPAKRIKALDLQSRSYKKESIVNFPRFKPESYWDEFAVDVIVNFLPLIGLLFGLLLSSVITFTPGAGLVSPYLKLPVLFLSLGYLGKTLFSYRGGEFPKTKVASLLRFVKVSRVRPVPATIEGKMIGRGIPGLVWSEDLVLQDETGYIFCDYRQPLRLIEFFFGLFRTGGFVGKRVRVSGWYRRGPTPYIEMKTMTVDGKTRRCYVYYVKWVVGIAGILISLVL